MATLTNNRLLIVDDNPAIHDDIRKVLAQAVQRHTGLQDAMAAVFGAAPAQPEEQIHFEVDSAFQGREAVTKIEASLKQEKPYAVAIVDVRMPPGWDGIETISQIWERDPEIQVVICTAYSDYSWQEITRQFGHTDRLLVMKKPFDDIEVLQVAHTLARKWTVTRAAAEARAEVDRLLQQRTQERDEIALLHVRLTREVAERERVEQTLRDSEERLSRVFDASPLPAAVLRVFDQRCIHANPAFLAATRRREPDVLGRTLRQCGISVTEEFCGEVIAAVCRGEKFEAHSCQFKTRRGEERQGLLWITPVHLATGPHVLAVLQDVSEQRALEAQLRQAQKMDAVGQLAAGIAHDFNNLLQVIHGHTSYQLMTHDLEPAVVRTLEDVQSAAERAAELTRQLLAFSRRQILEKRPLQIADVVTQAMSMLERVIPANVLLRFVPAGDLPPVYADPEQLQQIILNLAINSRDAMPEGGSLAFAATAVEVGPEQVKRSPDARPGHFVRLAVSDTGSGMDAETLSHVFEPFFSTKPEGEGSGMGLATVHGIVKQHDGWVEVISAPNHGTTFHIYLPIAATDAPAPAIPAPMAPVPLVGRTILLADDNADVRNIARYLLAASGCRVLTAANGVEALGIWKEYQHEISLLITDVVMPGGLSGPDLAARIHADEPSLPIIYSSGYSITLFRQELNIREGINYLPKPYLAHQLIGIVSRALTPAKGEDNAASA